MKRLLFLILALPLVSLCAAAQSGFQPAVTGYVTRGSSVSDFDANGYHILYTDKTKFSSHTTGRRGGPDAAGPLYIGEAVIVFGKLDRAKHEIKATEVGFTAPAVEELSGVALVDKVLSGPLAAVLLRADGYWIKADPSTQVTFTRPLSSLAEVTTNIWIKYHGKQTPEGILIADSVTFFPNALSQAEDKLLLKTNYDPESVKESDKQSAVSRYFLGINVKKIPPYTDEALQQRIDRIGQSLIPTFQRNLPDSDSSKINFRFQLVDEPKWQDARALPSGIILVPKHIVELLSNDSQLAAVLADNVTSILEKQAFRTLAASHTLVATSLAGDVAGIFVPGLSLATCLATSSSAKTIYIDLINQSGRVALGLMHDAGYDIEQAPLAWWTIAASRKKNLADIPLPLRAANLYKAIGTTWEGALTSASKDTEATNSATSRKVSSTN